MCVQRFDDSLIDAVHTTYRNLLRSSSMREPRDPLLKVLIILSTGLIRHNHHSKTEACRSPASALTGATTDAGGAGRKGPHGRGRLTPPEAWHRTTWFKGEEGV
jgi:hypothetical protein